MMISTPSIHVPIPEIELRPIKQGILSVGNATTKIQQKKPRTVQIRGFQAILKLIACVYPYVWNNG